MNLTTYQEELRELHHRRAYHITLVGGVLIMLLGLLDYLIVPEYFHEFLDYRIAVAIFSVALLVVNYFDKNKLYAAAIGLTEYLLISFILLFLIYRVDSVDTPYYVGLIVAMAIYSILAPITVVHSLLSGLFIVFCYAMTVKLSGFTVVDFSLGVFSNLFFMICFVFVISTQCWAETKARKKAFQLRQQELKANEELSRNITILEEEVRKRTIQQTETEERYCLLFDQIADDVVVLAQDASILLSNKSFTKHFLSDGAVKVTSFVQIVTFGDQEIIKNLITNTLITGKPVRSCSLTLVQSDGSTCETEINISRFPRNGGSLGILLVIRDIGTRRQLEKRLFASLKLKKETENAAIMSLAKLSEYRDITPRNHLERIREYCNILAIQLSRQKDFMQTISQDFILDIYHAAILHDIGKVSIPDELLNKQPPLTEWEEAKIRSHTLVGGNVIEKMEGESQRPCFLSMAKNIAYFHHERWDGNGYPYGLKMNEIPLEARIMAVADAYEELTTASCEAQDLENHEKATEAILQGSKTQFDPRVVEALFLRQKEFMLIRKKYAIV